MRSDRTASLASPSSVARLLAAPKCARKRRHPPCNISPLCAQKKSAKQYPAKANPIGTYAFYLDVATYRPRLNRIRISLNACHSRRLQVGQDPEPGSLGVTPVVRSSAGQLKSRGNAVCAHKQHAKYEKHKLYCRVFRITTSVGSFSSSKVAPIKTSCANPPSHLEVQRELG